MSVPGNINQLLIGAAASGGGSGYEIQRSLRFNSADSAYLDRTPSSASNRKTFTFSCWVKASNPGLERIIFQSANSWFRFNTNDAIYYYWSASDAIYTDAVLRDTSAWYHLILAVDTTDTTASNRIKIYKNGVQQSVSGTQPSQDADLDFNNNVIHYIGRQGSNLANMFNGFLAETHFVDGQQLAASDFGEYDSNNIWQPKEYSGSYGTNGFYLKFNDNSSNDALGTDSSGNGNTWNVNNITATAIDYVQSTTGSLYSGSWDQAFNGSTSTPAPYIYNTTASVSWDINISGTFEIYTSLPGTYQGSPTTYTLSDGTTASKSTTSAEWLNLGSATNATSLSVNAPDPGAYVFAIRVDGTILVSTAAEDTDSLIDTPTNYTADSGNNGGNYCTFNSLHPLTSGSSFTNGSLEVTVYGGNDRGRQVLSTLNPDSGKYYFEITPTSIGTTYIGLLMPVSVSSIGDARVAGYRSDGLVFKDGTNLGAVASTYIANDVIGVAYDIEGAEVKFYKNGTLEYTVSGITSSLVNVSPGISCDSSGATSFTTGVANFGQRSFAYTPPTDHLSICTKNLATPTISDGSDYFDTKLYTGNGSTQSISGYNFSPDFVWIKGRSGARNHGLFDTVRGVHRGLHSNLTDAEFNDSTTLTAFNSDGFDLSTNVTFNANTETFVAWGWDAGSSTGSNTDGTITSQVRANPTAGFSIVSYTGTGSNATIGHGLNAAPEFIVAKDRDNSVNWAAGHKSPTWIKYFNLNNNQQQQDSALVWQDTAPTSSVFSVGTSALINGSSTAYIAYCFAPVEGYSAFGSYTGNGLSDGPFVYTGFKPAFLLIKIYSGDNSNWLLLDSTRDTYNVVENNLYADEASAENQFDWVDFLSNGFKVKNTYTQINGSGYEYMYAAFAENPFQTNGGIAR